MNWDFTFQKIQTQTFSLAVKDEKRRHMSNVRKSETKMSNGLNFSSSFLFMITDQ